MHHRQHHYLRMCNGNVKQKPISITDDASFAFGFVRSLFNEEEEEEEEDEQKGEEEEEEEEEKKEEKAKQKNDSLQLRTFNVFRWGNNKNKGQKRKKPSSSSSSSSPPVGGDGIQEMEDEEEEEEEENNKKRRLLSSSSSSPPRKKPPQIVLCCFHTDETCVWEDAYSTKRISFSALRGISIYELMFVQLIAQSVAQIETKSVPKEEEISVAFNRLESYQWHKLVRMDHVDLIFKCLLATAPVVGFCYALMVSKFVFLRDKCLVPKSTNMFLKTGIAFFDNMLKDNNQFFEIEWEVKKDLRGKLERIQIETCKHMEKEENTSLVDATSLVKSFSDWFGKEEKGGRASRFSSSYYDTLVLNIKYTKIAFERCHLIWQDVVAVARGGGNTKKNKEEEEEREEDKVVGEIRPKSYDEGGEGEGEKETKMDEREEEEREDMPPEVDAFIVAQPRFAKMGGHAQHNTRVFKCLMNKKEKRRDPNSDVDVFVFSGTICDTEKKKKEEEDEKKKQAGSYNALLLQHKKKEDDEKLCISIRDFLQLLNAHGYTIYANRESYFTHYQNGTDVCKQNGTITAMPPSSSANKGGGGGSGWRKIQLVICTQNLTLVDAMCRFDLSQSKVALYKNQSYFTCDALTSWVEKEESYSQWYAVSPDRIEKLVSRGYFFKQHQKIVLELLLLQKQLHHQHHDQQTSLPPPSDNKNNTEYACFAYQHILSTKEQNEHSCVFGNDSRFSIRVRNGLVPMSKSTWDKTNFATPLPVASHTNEKGEYVEGTELDTAYKCRDYFEICGGSSGGEGEEEEDKNNSDWEKYMMGEKSYFWQHVKFKLPPCHLIQQSLSQKKDEDNENSYNNGGSGGGSAVSTITSVTHIDNAKQFISMALGEKSNEDVQKAQNEKKILILWKKRIAQLKERTGGCWVEEEEEEEEKEKKKKKKVPFPPPSPPPPQQFLHSHSLAPSPPLFLLRNNCFLTKYTRYWALVGEKKILLCNPQNIFSNEIVQCWVVAQKANTINPLKFQITDVQFCAPPPSSSSSSSSS